MKNTKFDTIESWCKPERLVLIFIVIGVVLRAAQFFFNRSLWVDEAALASSIVHRSYLDLLKPLENNQLAPFAFLMMERLMVDLFGPSEYALRFFPLICGVAGIFFMYQVARSFLKPQSVWIVLGLFAFSPPLIYFSTEVKQYSTDVAATLIALWMTGSFLKSDHPGMKSFLMPGIVGAGLVWFSHPVVFVLTGVGMGVLLIYLKQREWSKIKSLILPAGLWAVSFLMSYRLLKANMANGVSDIYSAFWADAFINFPPKNVWDLKAMFGIAEAALRNPGGFYFTGLAVFLLILGIYSFSKENRKALILLIMPCVVVLGAAALKIYPISERLILFLAPLLLIFVGEGLSFIKIKTQATAPIIGTICLILMFVHPVLCAGYHLVKPRTREEIKLVFQYLKEHVQRGDLIYVKGKTTGQYYAANLNRLDQSVIWGNPTTTPQSYEQEISRLRGHKRVWILFSHYRYNDDLKEDNLFIHHLDLNGRRLDSYEIRGLRMMFYEGLTFSSLVYLYDFN